MRFPTSALLRQLPQTLASGCCSTSGYPGITPCTAAGVTWPKLPYSTSSSSTTSSSNQVVVASSAATPATSESVAPTEPPAKRSYLPRWVRNLMPGGKNVEPEKRKLSAGEQQAAEEKEEEMKQLEEQREMTMDGYVKYCKMLRLSMGQEAERPRIPPVPMNHHDYNGFVDVRRATYLRYLQHEKIASVMTETEKQRVLDEGEGVLKDKKLLSRIADRTGIYMDLEVKDCFKGLVDTRRRALRLWRYVKEFEQTLPSGSVEQADCDKFMEVIEAEEKLDWQLSYRQLNGCPMEPKLPYTGPQVICSLTGLRYFQCCGAAEGKPQLQSYHHRLKPLHIDKFTPRHSYAVKKQYEKAQEPYFRKQ